MTPDVVYICNIMVTIFQYQGTDVKKSEGGPGRGYYLNGKFYSYTDDEKSEQ